MLLWESSTWKQKIKNLAFLLRQLWTLSLFGKLSNILKTNAAVNKYLCGLHCRSINAVICEYFGVHLAICHLPKSHSVPQSLEVCVQWLFWEDEHCNRKHFVDCGLFWITSVALLPRQQQLEKTRLPSREQLCFCSNQGYGEGSGFTWFLQKWNICHCSRY